MKLKLIASVLLFIIPITGICQQQESLAGNVLVENLFDIYSYEKPPGRKILDFKNKGTLAKLNPINYLSAGLLFFYQRIVSEQIQANCMYETSCSNYTKSCIERHGFRGFLLGIDQMSNCFENVIYDYPKYKISENFKVNNQIEE